MAVGYGLGIVIVLAMANFIHKGERCRLTAWHTRPLSVLFQSDSNRIIFATEPMRIAGAAMAVSTAPV